MESTYEKSGNSLDDIHPETKYTYRDDSLLRYPNYTELETKSGNEGFTKLSFGWSLDKGVYPKVNPDDMLPIPQVPSSISQPTDFRYKVIQGLGVLLNDSSLDYSNLDMGALLGAFEHVTTMRDLAGYIPDKLSFQPWAKLGMHQKRRSGFSLDFSGHLKFQIISESSISTQIVTDICDADVFNQAIAKIKTSKFGLGFAFGADASASFKYSLSKSMDVSPWSQIEYRINWAGKFPIRTDLETIEHTTAGEIRSAFRN